MSTWTAASPGTTPSISSTGSCATPSSASRPCPRRRATCPETLGFSLGTQEQIQRLEKDGLPLPVSVSDLKTYAKALFSFMLSASNQLHLDDDSLQRTVFIDNANVSTTNFSLSDELKQKLVDNGVLATSAWFKNAEQREAAAAQRATAS